MRTDQQRQAIEEVVVVVVFFQYNQSWTSLPSIVLSSNRYLVNDAWSFENCWTVIPVHLQLLVPLTFWPLAEIGWAKCLFPHHQSWNPNAGCRWRLCVEPSVSRTHRTASRRPGAVRCRGGTRSLTATQRRSGPVRRGGKNSFAVSYVHVIYALKRVLKFDMIITIRG